MINYKYSRKQIHCDNGETLFLAIDGTKEWYKNGLLHRDEDLPAIEYAGGYKSWWKDGKLHRDGDLSAIEDFEQKRWYKNGLVHRDNGLPAIEWVDGSKEWWVKGERHREGGLPAYEGSDYGPLCFPSDGHREWYIYGRELSEEQGLAYFNFCQKIQERKRIRAQKKIYFWWIQICYDLEHHSGCGIRMARKNLNVFETMMNV